MTTPRPKSKLDEVSEIIYKNPDDVYLSEFQATRLLKMTWDAHSQDFLRAKRQRMLIYYQSGQYTKAKAEMLSLIPYIAGNASLYMTLVGIGIRIGALLETSKIVAELTTKIIFSLPRNYQTSVLRGLITPYIFNGKFDKGVENIVSIIDDLISSNENIEHIDVESTKQQIFNFSNIYTTLDINPLNMEKLSNTIEEYVIKNKIRVLGAMISTPGDEFLIDLGVNKPVEDVVKYNDGLFDLVFERNLLDEFNAFSINFSPINEEQLKDALV